MNAPRPAAELLGLRWHRIDLEGGELSVEENYVAFGRDVKTLKEPKTDTSNRKVRLEARALAALRAYADRQADEMKTAEGAHTDDGLVFCDEVGRPLSPTWVSKAFVRIERGAGLPTSRST